MMAEDEEDDADALESEVADWGDENRPAAHSETTIAFVLLLLSVIFGGFFFFFFYALCADTKTLQAISQSSDDSSYGLLWFMVFVIGSTILFMLLSLDDKDSMRERRGSWAFFLIAFAAIPVFFLIRLLSF
jgi:hypothetical protein